MRKWAVILTFCCMSATVSCAGHRGPVNPNPTDAEVQQTRHDALVAATALESGLNIINVVGATVDALPVPVTVKDSYDCTILKITGTSPGKVLSAAVQQTCGVQSGPGPLVHLIEVAKAVTTQPALKATVRQALDVIKPLTDKLVGDQNPSLHNLGLVLAASLSVLSLFVGS